MFDLTSCSHFCALLGVKSRAGSLAGGTVRLQLALKVLSRFPIRFIMPSDSICSLFVPAGAAMEVVMSEEKKKIFRARKTMKISDRQQLETLHGALLTAGPGMSDASATPPLLNGTHKEDELRAGDKEQNSASDSNSGVASPSSPAPFLSLNLSPSPPSSHSPLAKDENPTSPTSPLHSPNFEMKKMGDEEEIELKEKGKERKGSPVSSSKDSVTPASTDFKENQEKDSEVTPKMEKKKVNAQNFTGSGFSHTTLYRVNVVKCGFGLTVKKHF